MPTKTAQNIAKVERFLSWHVSQIATPRWRMARLTYVLGISDHSLPQMLRRHGREDLLCQIRRPPGNYGPKDRKWMEAENAAWLQSMGEEI